MENYCNREDWIASYLDKALPEEKRLEFEEHIASCNSCLEELISAKAELREISAEMEDTTGARNLESGLVHNGFYRLFHLFFPPTRSGRSSVVQVALSCCAATAVAALFIVMMHSYRFDPSYREGTYLLGRLLEVRETGSLLLSANGFQPTVSTYTFRGNMRLHIDLSLDTAEQLKKALANHPYNAHVLSALGHYHMAEGQPEMAGIYYERALIDKPDDARLLNNLAAAAYRKGEMSEAERLLLQAEHSKPPPPEVFYNLGVLYGEMGNPELERIHLEKFIEVAPGSLRAIEARRMLEE